MWYNTKVGHYEIFTSEYGGDWYRPDGRKSSCMSRMSVGLVNHSDTIFNWQLSVANGCLISGPSLPVLSVGRLWASNSRLLLMVVRA